MAIIPFGKYKGKEISYVYENDLKYYYWLNSIELKAGFKEAMEKFKQNLFEQERQWVLELLEKAKKYRKQRETVFYINIHSVGTQYQIKDINTENILNEAFYINGKKVNEENFKILENYLYEENQKLGCPSKDRGLY